MDIDVAAFIRRSISPEPVAPDKALPGRATPILDPLPVHTVLGLPLGEVPDGCRVAYFALGCFWGAEKLFWATNGVVNTAAGYMGGYTPNPTYKETCTGDTGHTETVQVAYDPKVVSYDHLLRVFWENHDPTQRYRQGNDVGTQYRSAIFPTDDAQLVAAVASKDAYQTRMTAAGYGQITTEITSDAQFFYAEDYHQQYLDKNPDGYCPIHATGVLCSRD